MVNNFGGLLHGEVTNQEKGQKKNKQNNENIFNPLVVYIPTVYSSFVHWHLLNADKV